MPVFVKSPDFPVPHSRAPPTGIPGKHRRKEVYKSGVGGFGGWGVLPAEQLADREWK